MPLLLALRMSVSNATPIDNTAAITVAIPMIQPFASTLPLLRSCHYIPTTINIAVAIAATTAIADATAITFGTSMNLASVATSIAATMPTNIACSTEVDNRVKRIQCAIACKFAETFTATTANGM